MLFSLVGITTPSFPLVHSWSDAFIFRNMDFVIAELFPLCEGKYATACASLGTLLVFKYRHVRIKMSFFKQKQRALSCPCNICVTAKRYL